MSWTFNPPPGWPPRPEGWVPPPGWTPEPGWPPPPAGWQFWVPAGPAPPPPGPAGGAASSLFTAPAHISPPAPSYPSPPAVIYPPGAPATPGTQWFTRWWGILALVAALLIGAVLGFAGTNLGLAGPGGPAPAHGDELLEASG